MKFRPCIDIHDGKVKQIVGGTLSDFGGAEENFVSDMRASDYARLYKKDKLSGGHIIILNAVGSEYYAASKDEALSALGEYRGHLQIGGGINAENAPGFLEAGASHVIVTSFVFRNGEIYYPNLELMVAAVGKERLALDLSCRKKDGEYYIVTDRWQKFTEVKLNAAALKELSSFCSEFLVHAVDMEGKQAGVDAELVKILAESSLPVTYAGGVGTYEDLEIIRDCGRGRVDVTVGSALDMFGGSLEYRKVLGLCLNYCGDNR